MSRIGTQLVLRPGAELGFRGSPIRFKHPRLLPVSPFLEIAERRLEAYREDWRDFAMDGGFFKTNAYCETADYSLKIGYGAKEARHRDANFWQAIIMLQPNGWAIGGKRGAALDYQDAGDLILLDQSLMHQVCWDKYHPRPKAPWVVLLVDPWVRSRWDKSKVSFEKAVDMSYACVAQLEDPTFLRRFEAR